MQGVTGAWRYAGGQEDRDAAHRNRGDERMTHSELIFLELELSLEVGLVLIQANCEILGAILWPLAMRDKHVIISAE